MRVPAKQCVIGEILPKSRGPERERHFSHAEVLRSANCPAVEVLLYDAVSKGNANESRFCKRISIAIEDHRQELLQGSPDRVSRGLLYPRSCRR